MLYPPTDLSTVFYDFPYPNGFNNWNWTESPSYGILHSPTGILLRAAGWHSSLTTTDNSSFPDRSIDEVGIYRHDNYYNLAFFPTNMHTTRMLERPTYGMSVRCVCADVQ